MVSGLVYTFAALLTAIMSVISVLFGIYLVSDAFVSAINGDIEHGSYIFLQSTAMCIAAGALVLISNKLARNGIALFNKPVYEDIDIEEGEDEVWVIEEEDTDE